MIILLSSDSAARRITVRPNFLHIPVEQHTRFFEQRIDFAEVTNVENSLETPLGFGTFLAV